MQRKNCLFISLINLLLILAPSWMWAQSSYKDKVPANWKIIEEVKGDLNKDGLEDVILLIEKVDSTNIILNDGLGADTLNINPRGIYVFLQDAENNYTLIEENLKGFIPSENIAEAPCLMDPLIDGEVDVVHNILQLRFNYWYSCGTWYITSVVYKFRYQNYGMELIGMDYLSLHRASGDEERVSMNFSTKQKEETSVPNQTEGAEPKSEWSSFKLNEMYRLGSCYEDLFMDLLELE